MYLFKVAPTSLRENFLYSLENYLYGKNEHLNVYKHCRKLSFNISCMEAMQTDLNISLTISDLHWRNDRKI